VSQPFCRHVLAVLAVVAACHVPFGAPLAADQTGQDVVVLNRPVPQGPAATSDDAASPAELRKPAGAAPAETVPARRLGDVSAAGLVEMLKNYALRGGLLR
jgi:hypothetical protein